ncbi:RDD family protein [Candidatus Clostridium radicumherbarum]|uniref:RDD family protein n=1 Tax=Candidatus Clostridium radicumherbarum TaxID=3381662 RepID=A0ABW8TZR9_9CLOT
MNKNEFLRELENNLHGKIDNDDLQNILMDYAEIFESSKDDNKTEDETSNMIGSPSIVAKNILDEYTDTRVSKSSEVVNYEIASFGKRIAAFIIDSILSLLPLAIINYYGIINALFIAPINPFILFTFAIPHRPTNVEIAINLTVTLIFLLYGTVVMIILKNKTIGMYLMGIKVVKTNKSSLKAVDIILRQLLGKIIIPGLTFGISNIVSFFWALFSKSNNTVQDKIAGTLVIEDTNRKPVK